jgi:tetrapyrrole methylase family protein/MazG family protein/ATP diphosphatase
MTEKSALEKLLEVMARLRDPEDGCPWDLEQTFASIYPYTIEEAYEVAQAIEDEDWPALREELGDLLLQVVFHARMAEEADLFSFEDVAQSIVDKMVARHPHVFGDGKERDSRSQTRAWEALKAKERDEKARRTNRKQRILDGVALALPALLRAEKLQKRAAGVGFDWPGPRPVLEKIEEELQELRAEMASVADLDRKARDLSRHRPAQAAAIEEEIGDLLFATANLARHFGLDPEAALRRSNEKFSRRFGTIEDFFGGSKEAMRAAGLEQLESLWQAAKKTE